MDKASPTGWMECGCEWAGNGIWEQDRQLEPWPSLDPGLQGGDSAGLGPGAEP